MSHLIPKHYEKLNRELTKRVKHTCRFCSTKYPNAKEKFASLGFCNVECSMKYAEKERQMKQRKQKYLEEHRQRQRTHHLTARSW